ncbi:UNVERIFIED_CONTAM: hypothetical protein GTU68_067442 [Idotea baltica]|nr:hypothetical protein [Idotea baltica]
MRTIKGKQFVPLIPKEILDEKIRELAGQLEKDFSGKDPLFVGVLNGSFMFLSELFKNIQMACEVSFVKVKSYEEMNSTGHVKELIGLSENIENRHVVIVEDIIDTGRTMKEILPAFHKQNPASVSILTLLHKKAATVVPLKIDYVGFEVDNKFVIGFGLDFDGLGRNIDEILILAE